MRVIVADDDPDFLRQLMQAAPSWLAVEPCTSTREVVETMRETRRPDMAVIDLHMPAQLGDDPEREGLVLAEWMARTDSTIPVLFVTADLAGFDRVGPATASLGCLVKPVDLARLFEFFLAYDRLFRPGERSERAG